MMFSIVRVTALRNTINLSGHDPVESMGITATFQKNAIEEIRKWQEPR